MRKLSKLSLTHHVRLMAVGAAFVFSLAAVTASHAQTVFEDWESVDVAQGEAVTGWTAEWDFYFKGVADDLIETSNQTGHVDGYTKIGMIRHADGNGGDGKTPETWATYGDTVFTDTEMSSDLGSRNQANMRVGLVTRFTADVNENLSYYMARWQHDTNGSPEFELVRKTTLGAETVLVNMDVLGTAVTGTYPGSFLSFNVKDIGGQAHLEATLIGTDNGEYSISYIDSNPLGAGLVGVYSRTVTNTGRAVSFDNFQATIPEPALIGLMLGGLALVMTTLRRRRNAV